MPVSALRSGRSSIELWAPLGEVDPLALNQLRSAAALPWVPHHVAAMASVRPGHGTPSGSVLALEGAACPAAVGIDAGCGMGAVRTSLEVSQLLPAVDSLKLAIEQAIPRGTAHTKQPFRSDQMLKRDADNVMAEFPNLDPAAQVLRETAALQIGTLGGGDHFIQVCQDEEQRVWLTLHAGSRDIGRTLSELHIARAPSLAHNDCLSDRDLAVFLADTAEMRAYRRDISWAQRYAAINRRVLVWLLQRTLERVLGPVRFDAPVLCPHNYLSEEIHFGGEVLVARKDAISARQGEVGVTAGAASNSSFIVEGLGESLSYRSAAYGAGACDIYEVMQNQQDLVHIVRELKPIFSVSERA